MTFIENLSQEELKTLLNIIVFLFPFIIAIIGWYIHRQTERIKIMDNLLSDKKNDAYTELTGMFFDMLKQTKEGTSYDFEKGLEKMMKIKKLIFMYGSDKVYKALNRWLCSCSTNDSNRMLTNLIDLLVRIRKDLQHNSKICKNDIIISLTQSEKELQKWKLSQS